MPATTDLHTYLETTARQLKADLETIDGHIQRSVRFLVALGDQTTKKDQWLPQQVSTAQPHTEWEGSTQESVSTHLMVSHALHTISDGRHHQQLILLPYSPHRLRGISEKEWSTLQQRGVDLAERLSTQALNTIKANNSLNSETFGNNSPLVTCWFLEVTQLVTPPAPSFAALDNIFNSRENPKDEFYGVNTPPESAGQQGAALQTQEPPHVDRTRALYALRRLQENLLFASSPKWIAEYADYFLSKLHDHLSFYRIPDSRFDPAELAFNLEGALLCEKHTGPKVERATIETAIDVLVNCRVPTYNWRPVRPIVRRPNGLVLFPVNVEVANSLLRSLSHCSRDLQPATRAAAIAALRGYLGWLDTRAVRCADNLEGWHSEHINNERIIHSWETSQVLVFLAHLRKLLQDNLASELVRLGSFAETPATQPAAQSPTPHVSLCDELNYEKRIDSLFVDSRNNRTKSHSYGLLLYGPPGTGKTYAAQQLAKKIGYRLISLSVSDFLASGGIDIERQAKAVFEVIKEQHDTVVLFDEIDHLLLDRSHYLYSKMDTVFQFLTPGMLTKLQNLRDSRSVLFVINTNYEHRIDSAIKRTGRIDHGILVLPPDLKGRRHIIEEAWIASKVNSTTGEKQTLSPEQLNTLAKESVFLSYLQLNTITTNALSYAKCLEELRAAPRSWTFGSYESVLEGKNRFFPHEFTLSELMGTLAIDLESLDLADADLTDSLRKKLFVKDGEPTKAMKLFQEMEEQFNRRVDAFESSDLKNKFAGVSRLLQSTEVR